MSCARLLSAFRRCKQLDTNDHTTPLKRCLGILSLTALGTGSTLGLGVYVLAGAVAKTVAGPAVIVSFLIAGFASALAALCYAEFAARIPKAGSAYVYSYVSVGEFVAFTIGWNLILEYIIGGAGVAKGLALYIDSLTNYTMATAMRSVAPMNIVFLADYPDFFAFALVAAMTVLLGIGVSESTTVNNLFVGLNVFTMATVVITGAIYSDPNNWKIDPANIPEEYKSVAGEGGFAPFGVAGIMAGAAKCFYGYIGFDCLATCGEEAKNPKRDIPWSMVLAPILVFLAYFSISTVLTMMLPYYMQDADAPFPYVFTLTGLTAIKWIVSIGAIFALCTSMIGAMFPLPRVLYAMGSDGVLFRSFAAINPKTKTPLFATIVSGLFAAILTTIFNLDQLIDMMSIGTLLAYTIVATSVLVLRYDNEDAEGQEQPAIKPPTETASNVNLLGAKLPTERSAIIAKVSITVFFVVALVTCALMMLDNMVIPLSILGAILLALTVLLYMQPKNNVDKLYFSVPLVPIIPYVSVFINLYLMMQLDYQTWVRFVIWLIIGYLIYFFYGVKHSSLNVEPVINNGLKEGKRDDTKV
ncbi:high affinity cationic amino acid transporter 1-like isoform X2 [Anticarsia gemmatalis]